MATSKQRRDAERRRLQRQLERRRDKHQARRRNNLIFSIVGTLLVIAVVLGLILGTSGADDPPERDAAKSPVAPTSAPPTPSGSGPTRHTPTYPCGWTKTASAAKKVAVPATTEPPKTGAVQVSVRTTQGAVSLTLDRTAAPCTVASFVSLVQQGYYDSTPCHRLTTEGIYVLQCGDPTGSGSGDPGYSIPDEATGKESYPAGTIAMARSQTPHSGGSQFFIVYRDSPNLVQGLGQLQYTVFGTVKSGLGVIAKVAAKGAESGTDGKPKLPITLSTVTLAK